MQTSRRGFLGILGAGAVAAATEGCDFPETPHQRPPTHAPRRPEPARPPTDAVEFSEAHPERWNEDTAWMSNPENQAALERLTKFESLLGTFEEELRYGVNYEHETCGSISLLQQEEARAKLERSEVLTEFPHIAEALVRSKARNVLEQSLRVFGFCSMQGLVYQQIRIAAHRCNQQIPFERNGIYYATELGAFPLALEDIWSQDIDPRNVAHPDTEGRAYLTRSPGWSGARHKREFRTLVTDPELTALASEAHLNLAEYYSMVRVIIKTRRRGAPVDRTRDLDTARKCLERRETFNNQIILDEHTDNVLIFNGRSRDGLIRGGAETDWIEIANAVNVPPRNIRQFGVREGHNAGEVLRAFYNAIRYSTGKTFIPMLAHGAPEFVEVDQTQHRRLWARDLAGVLLQRVRETRDRDTLRDVTICIDACSSYDFTQTMLTALRDQWHVTRECPFTFDELYMPNIMTTTQESAEGDRYSTITDVLQREMLGLQRDQALIGRRITKNVQPDSTKQDIALFTSVRGAVAEFG